MAAQAFAVPSVVTVPPTYSPIVDLGAAQSFTERSFSCVANATTMASNNPAPLDSIDVYASQDNFATDSTYIGAVSAGVNGMGVAILPTIARYYRVSRTSINTHASPSVASWVGDAVPAGGAGGSVTATPPIVVTGSNISITPATDSAAGSMSQLDKTQTDAYPVGPSEVVYQDSGTAGKGVFTSFAAALASAVASFCTTIVVDDSLGQPIVPPGAYVIPPGLTLRALYAGAAIDIQDGAVLEITDVLSVDGLTLNWQATTTPPVNLGAGNTVLVIATNGGGFTADPAASVPFFDVSGGSSLGLVLSSSAYANGNASALWVSNASGDVSISLSQAARLANNSLGGSAPINCSIADGTVNWSTTHGASNITWNVSHSTAQLSVLAVYGNATTQIPGSDGFVTLVGWSSALQTGPVAGGSFDVSTGVFTAPFSGVFLFSVQLEFVAAVVASAGIEYVVRLYNPASIGTEIVEGVTTTQVASSNLKRLVQIPSTAISMVQGGQIVVQASQQSGNTTTLTTNAHRNVLSITAAPPV